MLFCSFKSVASESAQEIKSKNAVSLPSLKAAGPRSRFHSVTMKSGEVAAQHLSDCWHFHPTLRHRGWPAVTAGPGATEQGGLNVTAPSSPQR